MIPQRTLRSGLAGTELRERVSECRKRLRLNRFMQKATGGEEAACTNQPNATFPDAQPAMRESSLNSQLTSATGGDHYELPPAAETQGIGVT